MEMVEKFSSSKNEILNFLAISETYFDYPTLQEEAVDSIVSNLGNIFYNSSNQHSHNTSRRNNLLKFVNNLCQTTEVHNTDSQHYDLFLKIWERESSSTHQIFDKVHEELNQFNIGDIHAEISQFYNRKNTVKSEIVKKRNFISKFDEEFLEQSLLKPVVFYETTQVSIDSLLKDQSTSDTVININPKKHHEKSFRKKQIEFSYALINFNRIDKNNNERIIIILKGILETLASYSKLEKFEIKFIEDLWLKIEEEENEVIKLFPFLLEKLLIKFCTDIIQLENDKNVDTYFNNLNSNTKFLKFKQELSKNNNLKLKLKNQLFELYILSYCNENVYKFIDFLILS